MTRGQWITGLIFAAIIAVAVAGLYSGKDDTSVYDEKEREVHLEMIRRNSERIERLSLDSLTIRQKMYSDSLKYSGLLKANNEAYLKLKKKYNEINLSKASVHDLDSVVAALYGSD
jgi:hypothetical protein